MENTSLTLGFGRRDITPDFSVPLAGYGNTRMRMSQGYVNRIYATCLAFTDAAGKTMLVYTLDLIVVRKMWCDPVRDQVSRLTGIPRENIMLSATHTHSGPDVLGVLGPEDPYFDLYVQQLTLAAQDALADRKAATATVGRTDVKGMSFVRHYHMLDGSVAGDNHGDWSVGIRCHTMDPDEQLQVVRFSREDGKDILAVNWQAHPNLASTGATESGKLLKPFISADYVGTCRDYIEKKTDCLFAFFQGASGNLNWWSRIPEEMPTTDVHVYGQQLGDYVLQAMESMTPVALGDVQTRTETYTGRLDHSEDHMVPKAMQVSKLWAETNDQKQCIALGRPMGIFSSYHANCIISRSKMGTSLDTDLSAAKVGDLGFAFAPYEMFCNNGQFIKEHSPCQVTFVLECSNDYVSYIASKEGFDHGCYEVDSRRFVRGTGEEMADRFVAMLRDMDEFRR